MINDLPHQRECWDCKNIATHKSMVAPDVCCEKCGSQDTRRIKGWDELFGDTLKTNRAEINKAYLGDAVYATFDGFSVTLTTDGICHANVIVLEPSVIAALEDFIERCGKMDFKR